MHCTNCDLDLGPSAKFCSTCGSALAGVPALEKMRDWDTHVRVLGWLVIGHAAIAGLIGLIAMAAGQFVYKIAALDLHMLEHGDDPSELMFVRTITFVVGMVFMASAFASMAAGIGVLRYRSWGRVLTLVLSFLRLIEFPFGTFTAVYSFWILLSKDGSRFYDERAARAEM